MSYLLSNKLSDWSNSLAHASDPQLEFIFNLGCGFCSSVTSLEIYAVGLYACVKIYAVGQCACVEFQNKIVLKVKIYFLMFCYILSIYYVSNVHCDQRIKEKLSLGGWLKAYIFSPRGFGVT